MSSRQYRIALMWAVALALYVACWFLPILNGDNPAIGYDGAAFAHEMFFELLAGKISNPISASTPFLVIFASIGWMANELLILGIIILWKWPRIAVRAIAFSLGIMISWQVFILISFPLLIGYWLWVAAGAIAVWLSAERLARLSESSVFGVLTGRGNLSLVAFPIVNSAFLFALSPAPTTGVL